MRVLAPYVVLNVRVVNALHRDAPHAEFVYTGRTHQDYWQAIADRWQGKDDLMIVEQDNEIHDGVTESLASCDQPWCSYWYLGPPMTSPDVKNCMSEAIGCVKFSADLQELIPHEEIADYKTQCWDTVDNKLMEKLKQLGFSPHVHGQVRHHHLYQVFFLPHAYMSVMQVNSRWRAYFWRHVNKGDYPAYSPGGERYVPSRTPYEVKPDYETMYVDASALDGEEWRIYPSLA